MADAIEGSSGLNARRVARGLVRGALVLGALAAGLVLVLVLIIAAAFSRLDLDLGAGDGTNSARLAVDVVPRAGLADGGEVRVVSRAFDAGSVVGVAVCLRAADTEREGVDACDKTVGARFAVPPNGRLDVAFDVARIITVGGRTRDCAQSRCLVVAADVKDLDRSGGQEVRFADGLPAAHRPSPGEQGRSALLPFTVEPTGPVAPGARLSVTATGLVPGEPVLVAVCTDDFLRLDPWEACQPEDRDDAIQAIFGSNVGDINNLASAFGSYTAEVTVPRSVEPTSISSRAVPCAAAPGRCAVVITAAADTSRSAYVPLTVRPTTSTPPQ